MAVNYSYFLALILFYFSLIYFFKKSGVGGGGSSRLSIPAIPRVLTCRNLKNHIFCLAVNLGICHFPTNTYKRINYLKVRKNFGNYVISALFVIHRCGIRNKPRLNLISPKPPPPPLYQYDSISSFPFSFPSFSLIFFWLGGGGGVNSLGGKALSAPRSPSSPLFFLLPLLSFPFSPFSLSLLFLSSLFFFFFFFFCGGGGARPARPPPPPWIRACRLRLIVNETELRLLLIPFGATADSQ